MKVNHKQMFLMLKQQAKVLQAQLSSVAVEQVNEIPANFNQVGWDLTIEKVEQMLNKMKELREIGKAKNRLTPQFYRSIYNRALIANGEIDKLQETLTADADDSVNYEAECVKLTAEIHALNMKVAEKAEADRKAAEQAEADAKKAQAEADKQSGETGNKGANGKTA